MKKKIINKRFYVDETKNTCVCVLDFCLIDNSEIEYDAINDYARKCKCADKEPYLLEEVDEEGNPIKGSGILVRKFRVRGKAKCSPEDEFDSTIGTDISEFRAELQMSRIQKEVIISLLKKVKNKQDEYEALYNKVSLYSEMRKSCIEDVINPEK